jgi:glycosyltransferase involved in cell wall biosynthesis
LPRDRFLALFVGRDVAKKGLDHFLAAGDGSYDLVAVTDRPAGTERRARLIPFMSHERLQELLGAVDAFVLPSIGEGFPVVIQEAFGHGLPVVTTADEGYEHYVGPGDALFVRPDGASIREALVQLASEPVLRDRLSRNAKAVAEREFSSTRFVEAYEELYERALAAGAG